MSAATRRQLAEAIDAETRRRNLPSQRERIERAFMSGEPILPSRGPRAVSQCKTEGCENPANGRYDRGPLAGLCEPTCVPRRKEELAEQSRQKWAERRGGASVPTPPIREEQPMSVVTTDTRRDVEGLLRLVEGLGAGRIAVYEDAPDGSSRRNDQLSLDVKTLASKTLSAYDSSVVGEVVKEQLLNGSS